MEEEKVTLSILSPEKLHHFLRALNNVLATDLAGFIFAQIIDGLPVRDDVGYQPSFSMEIGRNDAPSAKALSIANDFKANFETSTLRLDIKRAQAYDDADPESPEFTMRLLELIAVAFHDIAALVYTSFEPGIREIKRDPESQPTIKRPTPFMLLEYRFWEQYPEGLHDLVGYWAEYHFFGGVVLFDRGENGNECKGVFLHPVSRFKIFQLSETQIRHFVDYSSQQIMAGNIPPPFPFKAERYAYDIDPYDSMAMNIYRDKYERIIPRERPLFCVRRPDSNYNRSWDRIQEILKKREENWGTDPWRVVEY